MFFGPFWKEKKNHQKRNPKKGKKEEGKYNSTPRFLDTQFQLSTVKLRDLERERERERERWRWREGERASNLRTKGDGGWLNGGCILNKFVIKPAEFQGQAGARDLGEDR
jgi:hypothetical protein